MVTMVPFAAGAPTPKPDKTLSFDSATYETTEGYGSVCAYVDRSVTKGKAPTAMVTTRDGTATAGSDYSSVSSTVSFAKKSSQGYVCVPILVDGVPGEPDETFTLKLSTSSTGWILGATSTATVTIHEMAAPSGAPTDLAASLKYDSAGDPYVELMWTWTLGDHYWVGSSTTSGGPYTELGLATGLPYTTSAPTENTYYVVEVTNTDNGTSSPSNEAYMPAFVPGAGLYWADNFGGRIKAANLDGSGAHVLLSGVGSPISVAVDANHVYWTGGSTVMESNLDGTGVTTLYSSTADSLYGVAVNATYIYWADYSAGTIMRADLNGDNVTTLVTGEFDPSSVAIDASHIYWVNWLTSGGTIKEADLNGGNATTLVTGQDLPFALAVDGSYVYWVNQGEINSGTGTLNRALLSNPSQITVLASNQWHPDGIAVAGGYVYWANSQAGTINRANLDGSNKTVLVSGTSQPAGVAVATS
ncbi:MAG: DUF5050 domain-containing protein [Acidobacteriota bacterium]|nr:DUF5050 domain-containing protein [Acidobacteriota bacterium]